MEANRYPTEYEDTEESFVTDEQAAIGGLKTVRGQESDSTPSDLLRLYFKDIAEFELLPRHEVNRLSRLAQQGDLEAKHALMNSNQGLVIDIARGYIKKGLPLADLIQEGNIGLNRAVEKFNPDLGYAFSTYATWWIRQAVSRAIHEKCRTIHYPTHVSQLVRRVNKKASELTQTMSGLEPSPEDIALEIEAPVDKVAEIKDFPYVAASLDKPVNDEVDSEILMDFAASYEESFLDEMTMDGQKTALADALMTLSDSERQILELYYGLGGQQSSSFRNVAKELGIREEHVVKFHAEALDKLRRSVELANAAHDPDNFEPQNGITKPALPENVMLEISEKANLLKSAAEEKTKKAKKRGRVALADTEFETWATIIVLDTTDKVTLAKALKRPENTIKAHRTNIKKFAEAKHFDHTREKGRVLVDKALAENR
jgi:RNA polymerase sigma factor (sigma-70 family)